MTRVQRLMVTFLVWILGTAALFAGVALTLAAALLAASGQYPETTGTMASLAVLAFAVVWLCRSPVLARRAAAERARWVVPCAEVPGPASHVIPLERAWWAFGMLLIAATLILAVAIVAFLLRSPQARAAGHVIVLSSAGMMLMAAIALSMLWSGWVVAQRARALGGLARFDAAGARHCLLTPIPWSAVQGMTLRPGHRGASWLFLHLHPSQVGMPTLTVWPRFAFDDLVRIDPDGAVGMCLPSAVPRSNRAHAQAVASVALGAGFRNIAA